MYFRERMKEIFSFPLPVHFLRLGSIPTLRWRRRSAAASEDSELDRTRKSAGAAANCCRKKNARRKIRSEMFRHENIRTVIRGIRFLPDLFLRIDLLKKLPNAENPDFVRKIHSEDFLLVWTETLLRFPENYFSRNECFGKIKNNLSLILI